MLTELIKEGFGEKEDLNCAVVRRCYYCKQHRSYCFQNCFFTFFTPGIIITVHINPLLVFLFLNEIIRCNCERPVKNAVLFSSRWRHLHFADWIHIIYL